MPVLRLIREPVQAAAAAQRRAGHGLLARDNGDRQSEQTLKAGGADVRLCASNPLSTQDDVAAALVQHDGIPTFAIKGEDNKTYYGHIESALAHRRNITMDDGADVVSLLHSKRKDLLQKRDRRHGRNDDRRHSPAQHGGEESAQVPVIAVNDADTKHMFDNRYGTGQSPSTESSARPTG